MLRDINEDDRHKQHNSKYLHSTSMNNFSPVPDLNKITIVHTGAARAINHSFVVTEFRLKIVCVEYRDSY